MTFDKCIGAFLSFALLLPAAVGVAAAQSLGDVARREADRRKQVTSGRVYTNGDLTSVDPPQAPATAPAVAAPTPAAESPQSATKDAEASDPAAERPEGEKGPATSRPKRDEPYWRARAKDLRGRLAKAEANAASTEARLAEIDAAGAPELAREREIVAAALARLQAEVRYRRDEVAQFEALAQFNKVPPDWIR